MNGRETSVSVMNGHNRTSGSGNFTIGDERDIRSRPLYLSGFRLDDRTVGVYGTHMTNRNAHHTGQRIRIVAPTRTRRHAVDFPGWGADNYADFLLPIEVGMTGVITSVESHGINPWTRYSIRFDDGTTTHGIVPDVIGR